MKKKEKIANVLNNRVVKNAGWLIFGKIAQMCINLFVGLLTARYLGPSNYGVINYGSAYTAFFLNLCTLGINSVLVKEFVDYPNEEGKIIGTTLGLKGVASVLSAISIMLISSFIDANEPTTILVVDLLAFLITFLVVTILVRTIMYALNIIGDLPVLHGLNRVAGAFLGMGTALVIVWVLFMIITLSYRTGFGKASMDMIDKSPLLTFLYDHNYIMNAIIKFH